MASRVVEAIAKFKKIPLDQITYGSTFEELGIDSLDGLQLFFEIEGEFSVNIPDNQLRHLQTVEQAVECIRQLIAAA